MCPRGKTLPLNTVVHDFTPQIMLKWPGGLEEKGLVCGGDRRGACPSTCLSLELSVCAFG